MVLKWVSSVSILTEFLRIDITDIHRGENIGSFQTGDHTMYRFQYWIVWLQAFSIIKMSTNS